MLLIFNLLQSGYYGYLKVEITGAPAEDRITATTEYTFNEEFTLSCRTEDWVNIRLDKAS